MKKKAEYTATKIAPKVKVQICFKCSHGCFFKFIMYQKKEIKHHNKTITI